MQAIPELMYFLDKDPTVSAFFRNRALVLLAGLGCVPMRLIAHSVIPHIA